MKLFDTTLVTLKDALDVRLLRQNVLAGNVANADTPGYRPQELDFEAAMRAVTQVRSQGGTRSAAEVVAADPDSISIVEGGNVGLDGNAVDLDQALVGLSENAMQYGASTRAISKKLAILRFVASDGNA